MIYYVLFQFFNSAMILIIKYTFLISRKTTVRVICQTNKTGTLIVTMDLILADFSMMTMASLLVPESHNGCGLVQVHYFIQT